MSTLVLEKLVEMMGEHPLERKLLLCQGYAEGHQLLEQLCRQYGPVLNMEAETLRGLAEERTRLKLFRRGMTAVSMSDTYWLTYEVLRNTIAEQPGFLTQEQLTPGLIEAFHRTLQELREAGVQAGQLKDEYFENPEKGRFVQGLLQGYENQLDERKLADYTALVRLLPETDSVIEIVAARRDAVMSWADRTALERLSGGRGIMLSDGLPFTDPNSGFPVKTSRLFQANGVLAEVREVFRRMLEERVPWDQAEIILSDYTGAVTAVHSTAAQIGAACTFAEGLPVRYSTVGRGALVLLDWAESDYHTEHLMKAFRERLLQGWDENVSASSAVNALEASGIGWGRERYDLLDGSNSWTTDEQVQTACLALGGLVKIWFDAVPSGRAGSPRGILKALCDILGKYSTPSTAEEQLVLTQLQDLHRSSGYMADGSISLSAAIRLVRERVESFMYRSSGIPAEGAVYISGVNSGGLSGRPYTFVVGMNERAWRVASKQDPVLLDEERRRISTELWRSGAKAELAHRRKLERLGAVRGSCMLSFSAYDLAERREQYPAYELLQIYRLQSGRMEADFEELQEQLGALHSYFPSSRGYPLDEADAWMKQLVNGKGHIRNGLSLLYRRYENLRNGAAAEEAREASAEAAEFDGMVDTALHGIEFTNGSGGKALSASRLELYARCPMQFYYQEVLRLRGKEAPEFDRTRWLGPAERGSLLHEIFEKYYAPWAGLDREDVEVVHDKTSLERITEEILADYAVRIPAPSPHIRQKESDSIRRDAEIFFRQEESRSSRPAYLELRLHKEDEPFALELSEELSLPLRGIVDRVDRIGPHQYRIVDYKTGRPSKYKEQDYFAGGTQLQHALYALAVEQWLKKSGRDLEAQVVEAAYYFPTEKGLGEELVRMQNRKEELVELLKSLLGSMRSGVFPPTWEPSHCSYCDYLEVCGKHAHWMKDKGGERLQLLQEVYSHA